MHAGETEDGRVARERAPGPPESWQPKRRHRAPFVKSVSCVAPAGSTTTLVHTCTFYTYTDIHSHMQTHNSISPATHSEKKPFCKRPPTPPRALFFNNSISDHSTEAVALNKRLFRRVIIILYYYNIIYDVYTYMMY